MYSVKVEEQTFARKILQTHIQKKRLANTYLLTGKKGSGKKDLAVAFAAALFSGHEFPFDDLDNNACKKVFEGNHPDFQLIGEDETVRSIKIEEVKKLVGQASLKPYEAEWKVYVLNGADRLTPDASNALLKTLEEPPAHTIFMLLAASKAHLLETIQSRSFEVRLRPLGDDSSDGFEDKMDIVEGFGRKPWHEYFETFEKHPREKLKVCLEYLMACIRNKLVESSKGSPGIWSDAALIQAIEIVGETKDAVASNVNQKLALSRLTMRFMKLLPATERV